MSFAETMEKKGEKMGSTGLVRKKRVDMDGSGSLVRIDRNNGLNQVTPALPDSFNEIIEYSPEVPYSIVKQLYREGSAKNHSYLHYADTLEIMVFRGLRGTVTAYGNQYLLDNSPRIFVILPGIVHDVAIEPSEQGMEICLKFDLQQMKNFLDLQGFLKYNGRELDDLAASQPDLELFWDIVMELAEKDNENIYARMSLCLSLFRLLDQGISSDFREKGLIIPHDETLNRLIRWTNIHYCERITLEDAAAYVNMDKYYFCKYFKKNTCTTYLQYVLQLRINHAEHLLLTGKSVTDCCYECGFDSVSYFIQLFKKKVGCTAAQYRERVLSQNP